MENLQQKILDIVRPLSRLWKELVDIKNDPDDTVPVSVLNYIT